MRASTASPPRQCGRMARKARKFVEYSLQVLPSLIGGLRNPWIEWTSFLQIRWLDGGMKGLVNQRAVPSRISTSSNRARGRGRQISANIFATGKRSLHGIASSWRHLISGMRSGVASSGRGPEDGQAAGFPAARDRHGLHRMMCSTVHEHTLHHGMMEALERASSSSARAARGSGQITQTPRAIARKVHRNL